MIFIPIAMGFDITESWAAIWRKQAAALGYTFEIRDPNWSTDAGTKALTAAIAEKPDLLIIHNPDIQSYARLLKRAQDEGIKVLQVNMPSVTTTDSYVGADWVRSAKRKPRRWSIIARPAKARRPRSPSCRASSPARQTSI